MADDFYCIWCGEPGEVRPDGTFECMNPKCGQKPVNRKPKTNLEWAERILWLRGEEFAGRARDVLEGLIKDMKKANQVADAARELIDHCPDGINPRVHAAIVRLRELLASED